MEAVLAVALILSLVLNAYLARGQRAAFEAVAAALGAAQAYQELSSFWHRVAQRFQALAAAREGMDAILSGDADVALEHPDPAVQAEANKMMTDLLRLRQMLRQGRGAGAPGSSADN